MRKCVVLVAGFAALAPVVGRGETITVTAETCAALATYEPAPDVEYQPGVDVNGAPVAPADLGGTPRIEVPRDISVSITVELAHVLGIPAFPDPAHPQNDIYKPEAAIGIVTYKDGKFAFNGQPLQSDAEAALAKLCQQQGQGRKERRHRR